MQLVQNYVYPWVMFGQEPMATWLKAGPDEPIRIFPENEINVVVVGGEANAIAISGRQTLQYRLH